MPAAIDLRAVVNIEDVHNTAGFVDPIEDPIGAAARAVTPGEWPGVKSRDVVYGVVV